MKLVDAYQKSLTAFSCERKKIEKRYTEPRKFP